MPSVDVVNSFMCEFLVGSSALRVDIRKWTNGAIEWQIISCALGFEFLFRKFLAERFVHFSFKTWGHEEKCVNGDMLCMMGMPFHCLGVDGGVVRPVTAVECAPKALVVLPANGI